MLIPVAQFDFEKVYIPAGYANAAVARNMFGRLLDKIADGQVTGTLRRNPRASKGKAEGKARAAEDADHHSEAEEAALAAAEEPAEGSGFTPINRKDTSAKRKTAEDAVTSEPKKRSRHATKVAKNSEGTKATEENASIQGELPVSCTESNPLMMGWTEDMKTTSVQKNDDAQDELPNQGKDELLG